MAPLIFTLLLLVPYQISAYSPCFRSGQGYVHCISKCKQLQMWSSAHPGMTPGQSRWGSVMEPGSFEDMLSKFCGSETIPAMTGTIGDAAPEPSVDPTPTPVSEIYSSTISAGQVETGVSGAASSPAPIHFSEVVTDTPLPTPTPPKSTLGVSPSAASSPAPIHSSEVVTDTPLPTPIPSKSTLGVSPKPTKGPGSTKDLTTTIKQKQYTTTPELSISPPPSPILPGIENSPGSGDQNDFLSAHNNFRADFPIPALKWSDKLASTAQQWVNNCKFEHSGGKFGRIGENLAAGAGGGYNIASAVKSWTDEEKDYNPRAPAASHFTQVVWKSTTEVGCAKAMCNGIFDPSFGKSLLVVCQYSPPGNVIGEFAENVLPRNN